MKTLRDIILIICAIAFFIGAFVVVPYGHYERTYDENEFEPEIYSEHVVDYPTKNENIFGFSLIAGSLIIGLSALNFIKTKKG